MDWLNKLLKSTTGADSNVLWLYVQCGRCGSPLAVRVNRRNEMTPDYETGGYVLHKEMMDSKCFQLMHAEVHLDGQGRLVSQTIDRGKFLTQAEYENFQKTGK